MSEIDKEYGEHLTPIEKYLLSNLCKNCKKQIKDKAKQILETYPESFKKSSINNMNLYHLIEFVIVNE